MFDRPTQVGQSRLCLFGLVLSVLLETSDLAGLSACLLACLLACSLAHLLAHMLAPFRHVVESRSPTRGPERHGVLAVPPRMVGKNSQLGGADREHVERFWSGTSGAFTVRARARLLSTLRLRVFGVWGSCFMYRLGYFHAHTTG